MFTAAYTNKPMKGSVMKYFYYRLKIHLCPAGGCLISFAEILFKNLNPNGGLFELSALIDLH